MATQFDLCFVWLKRIKGYNYLFDVTLLLNCNISKAKIFLKSNSILTPDGSKVKFQLVTFNRDWYYSAYMEHWAEFSLGVECCAMGLILFGVMDGRARGNSRSKRR